MIFIFCFFYGREPTECFASPAHAHQTENIHKRRVGFVFLWRRDENTIVHDYVGVDLAIVYKIITNDLKTLKLEIIKIIKEKIEQKTFDSEEIKICKESSYYKHIDFREIN